ncbi:MAG: hypothetical protein ACLP5O_05630 [Acidimicrobiales bacterium]
MRAIAAWASVPFQAPQASTTGKTCQPSLRIEKVGMVQQVPMATPEMITWVRPVRAGRSSSAARKVGSS